MPNNYDFNKLANVKAVEIDPDGWISPLFVEYGTGFHGEVPAYFWRVKGTKHTFVIPILRMDYLSQGDYEKHFKDVLNGFREEYIGWEYEQFYTPWMKEYKEMFEAFIIK